METQELQHHMTFAIPHLSLQHQTGLPPLRHQENPLQNQQAQVKHSLLLDSMQAQPITSLLKQQTKCPTGARYPMLCQKQQDILWDAHLAQQKLRHAEIVALKHGHAKTTSGAHGAPAQDRESVHQAQHNHRHAAQAELKAEHAQHPADGVDGALAKVKESVHQEQHNHKHAAIAEHKLKPANQIIYGEHMEPAQEQESVRQVQHNHKHAAQAELKVNHVLHHASGAYGVPV